LNRESALRKRIQIWATRQGWRLFRNVVSSVWVGKPSEGPYRLTFRNRETEVVELYDARCIKVGLCEGSSDLVGWRTLRITPEMVGQRIAQFCAVEAKTVNMRAPTQKQRNFLRQVAKSGGYAAVVRDNNGILKFEEVRGNGNQNGSDMRVRKHA